MLTLALAAALATVPNTKTDFTRDVTGWTSTPEVRWTGDNRPGPSSFLIFTDAGPGEGFIHAPSGWLGDWSEFNGGEIGFDHRILATSSPYRVPHEIRLTGPGGSAVWTAPASPLPATGWIRHVAPLVESEWTVTSGSWSALLQGVASFSIRCEVVYNQSVLEIDVEGIDRVYVKRGNTLGGPGPIGGGS